MREGRNSFFPHYQLPLENLCLYFLSSEINGEFVNGALGSNIDDKYIISLLGSFMFDGNRLRRDRS
jgi:hypothetical protein